MLLYADKDFSFPAVEELRRFGHDVLTAQDDGRVRTPDRDVLARAHSLGRCVLTHNRWDFERLHQSNDPILESYHQRGTMMLSLWRDGFTPHFPD